MRKQFIKDVIGQLANMLENNFCQDYVGSEPFMGWLQDGEVWEDENLTEEEIKERLDFAKKIAPIVDNLSDVIEYCNE
jgi:hypothetical protein